MSGDKSREIMQGGPGLPHWANAHPTCAEHGAGIVGWTDGPVSVCSVKAGDLVGSMRSITTVWHHRRDVRYGCECIKTVSMTPINTEVDTGSEVTVHRHRDA